MSVAAWVLLTPLEAHASAVCGDDTTATVDDTLSALWEAYAAVDEAQFDRAGKNLTAAIACLDVVPSPVQISRLHQGMALLSFVSGQTRASRRSLAAARLLDPGWKLDARTFPDGHPLRDLWGQATDPGPVDDIGRIHPDRWIVDGYERDDAPVERAFLLQVQAEDGEILWSGYLWSFEEIPDRGQGRWKSPLATPHALWLSLGLQGRVLSADQRTDAPDVLRDQAGTAVGGGLALQARFTPLSVLGGELAAAVASPGDPVLGGGSEPSGHAALLVGGGGWAGALQPYGALRAGVSLDHGVAWSGVDPVPTAGDWMLVSMLIGAEGGIRGDRARAGLATDVLLAEATVPWAGRVRLDGGWALIGPLAVEGALAARIGSQSIEDVDGTPLGHLGDTDVRVTLALALWN
ncbi:MAG: hypothetical protein H6735_25450 [Alphaproteobacteria bacterium]|nr:hypothetical protein [Alphaproteobacteria bacterium]